MQQPYILGIDIGTGSTKAVGVDLHGSPFHSQQVYYNTFTPQAGYAEQDPEEIFKAFVNCLKEVISAMGAPLAVCFSSAMHSVIPVDDEGRPLHRMITWADARSANIAERIRRSADAEAIYRNTGTPIYAMSPLSKMIWLRENEPVIFSRTSKFISIKEFIWHRLFKSYQVDYSIACGTGLFHIVNHTWNDQSLQLAGIHASQLSDPVDTNYSRNDHDATYTGMHFLPPQVPFIIGGSDGCLANLGSLAIYPGVAALTIGTSGAVRVSNTTPVYHFEAMTFNYYLDEGHFICGGPVNNGGIVLQWLLKKMLGKPSPSAADYESLFREAGSIPAGSEGLVFLPYLSGERAPHWTTETCGVFFGIMHQHASSHFCRAVLEGVCFSLKQVLEAVESNATPVTRIHVSGGFVQSLTWIQMLADITGKPICIVSTEDASAVGAAFLAMKTLNLVSAYSELETGTEVTIEPDSRNFQVYEKNYLIFKSLFPSLKQAMHQLHQN